MYLKESASSKLTVQLSAENVLHFFSATASTFLESKRLLE